MLSRIYILISILTTTLLFAQANTANSSSEKEPRKSMDGDIGGPIPKGNYLTGIQRDLSILEKNIADKVSNLEKLQNRAAELDKGVKEKVFIADKVPSMEKDGGFHIVTSRHIEFTFASDKTKEIKIVSSKKRMTNDLHSIVRTLTFTPGDVSSIKIKVDTFNSRMKGIAEIQEYKSLHPEVKLIALRSIDLVLYNTIFKFDALVQKAETDKLENSKSHLSDL